jgi:hypothetical protein
MSFLAEPPDAAFEESRPPPDPAPASRFGQMKVNPNAKTRRGKVKLFDSADWAMKNKDANATESDSQAPKTFYLPEDTNGDSAIAGSPDE